MAADDGIHLWRRPHHDGSRRYLPEPPTRLGQEVDVFLHAPREAGVSRVALRQVHDGEPVSRVARIDRSDDTGDWWRATLTQHNPVVNYRFLTDSGPDGYRWITAAGAVDHDPTDAHDFRSSLHPGAPDWVADAVAYQIFPDRFARSGAVGEPLPAWAVPASWDDPVIGRGRGTAQQFYGGDLVGVEQHLDHIAQLGADLLYLTPVFPAPSNHRYNAADFDHVDPLLGGDQAYAALLESAHRRGMRVIGDITTNHTGNTHHWFRDAQADRQSVEADFYLFRDHPDDYVGWFGVQHLPKLDYRSQALLQRMVTGPDSPIRRYLRPPFELDGWRVDVANMTGRHADVDLNHEVARAVRQVVAEENPQAYLVGEHFHDYRDDLPGDGWQGVMNYAGFSKPLWSWLTDGELDTDNWLGIPWRSWPRTPGTAMVATMNEFSGIGWQHRLAGMNIIGSHDTPRIRSITSDPALVEVAVAAMMTMPGLPMVWAGDEIGMAGRWGEDGRRPFPWQRPDLWDRDTLQVYRRLIRLRREQSAVRHGSMRWLYSDADRVVYAREHGSHGVLVLLARAAGQPISLSSPPFRLHPGVSCDSLYSDATAVVRDGFLQLPGDGPGVAIWGW